MTRMVQCVLLGEELPGLERPPYPGALGQRIYEQVSSKPGSSGCATRPCSSTNTGLSVIDPKARTFLEEEMEKFFFGGGAAKKPEGYKAPSGSWMLASGQCLRRCRHRHAEITPVIQPLLFDLESRPRRQGSEPSGCACRNVRSGCARRSGTEALAGHPHRLLAGAHEMHLDAALPARCTRRGAGSGRDRSPPSSSRLMRSSRFRLKAAVTPAASS